MQASETASLQRFRSADTAAIRSAVDQAAPLLLSIALARTRSWSDAEDLVQEPFVTALRRANRFDREKDVMPWLCGILANHWRMQCRSRQRRSRREAASAEGERWAPAPEEDVAFAELERELRAAC